MLKKIHGHCPHIPWHPWTLSTYSMESMDIVHTWNTWTMGPYGPRARDIICYRLIIGNIWKKIFSETAISKARIHVFSMQLCYMMLYIDPTNDAPGVQNGPTPGDISSHVLTIGKAYKNRLRNHESRNYYIKCVAMFNNPLYKFLLLPPVLLWSTQATPNGRDR